MKTAIFWFLFGSKAMVYLIAFSIDRFGGWNRGEYIVKTNWDYPTKGYNHIIKCKLPY